MSEENKIVEEKKCICQNETFRKILTIAVGTFIGVYCALSLFTAIHRPPMMPPMPAYGYHHGFKAGCPNRMMPSHHFIKKDFDFKKHAKGEFPKPVNPAPSPFENGRGD